MSEGAFLCPHYVRKIARRGGVSAQQAAEGLRRDHFITIWFAVRVLPGPPRILVLTEISRLSATSPELAGLISEIWSLQRRL